MAEALHGVAKVAAVNCEQQQALCQEQGVRGYPTIKAFRWAAALLEGRLLFAFCY